MEEDILFDDNNNQNFILEIDEEIDLYSPEDILVANDSDIICLEIKIKERNFAF